MPKDLACPIKYSRAIFQSGGRMKSWTVERGNFMYAKDQEEHALKEYECLGSITAVIRQFEYPSESTLYRWYEYRRTGLENRHGHTADVSENTEHRCNTLEHGMVGLMGKCTQRTITTESYVTAI